MILSPFMIAFLSMSEAAAHVGNVTIDLLRSNGFPCRHVGRKLRIQPQVFRLFFLQLFLDFKW
jgi:hypothetical protein